MSFGHQAEFFALSHDTETLERALQELKSEDGPLSVPDQDAQVILEQALRHRRADDRLRELLGSAEVGF